MVLEPTRVAENYICPWLIKLEAILPNNTLGSVRSKMKRELSKCRGTGGVGL